MTDIRISHPRDLSEADWEAVHALQFEAFADTLLRDPIEIEALVGRDDHERFVRSHVDPNTEVGERFAANQLYTYPRMVVAREAGVIIGFAYGANNTSGGGSPEGPHNESIKAKAMRQGKRLIIPKNYLWLREIAVDPSYQRQGVAQKLGRALLQNASAFQNATAYIWPSEVPFLQSMLERLGMVPTGETNVKIFGDDGPEVKQVRMEGSVATALNRLSKKMKAEGI